MYLRCEGRIHGELIEIEHDGQKMVVLETKCRSQQCGARNAVVLHRFDIKTGELVDTKRYSDPSRTTMKQKEEQRSDDLV